MNWKNWPYWLRGGVIGGNYRLTKIDLTVIIVMSLVLSALTFFSNEGYFFHLQRGNQLLRAISVVFYVPALIGLYPLVFLSRNSHDPEGAALGDAIFATFLSPVLAFLLWFIIFCILVRINVRFFRSKHFLARHATSLIIFAIIFSPYAYYMLGTNALNACLSGELSTTEGHLSWGPDDCFKTISENALGYANKDPKKSLSFCKRLSDTSLVVGDDPFYQRPPSLSYRDFCLYILDPLPAGELCGIVGGGNIAEEKKCLGYFIWRNRPRNDSGIIINKADISLMQTSGKVVYDRERGEVSLVKGDGDKENTWFAGTVSVSNGLTHLEFDADLLNADKSEALLTVYAAAKNVASVNGRSFSDGKHHFQFEFPAYGPGEYMLGFRLDTFAHGLAQIKISNISTGFRDYPGMFDVPHDLIR